MPIIPSIFQPIRANDVHLRPIKAHKYYEVGGNTSFFETGSGYYRHTAIYKKNTPHIFAYDGSGVGSLSYNTNEDHSNVHVVWNTIDHKYYRYNNPAFAFDFTSIEKQKRFIFHSASILTCPYFEVGEKVKPGSFEITSSIGGNKIMITDDGDGNLVDPLIDTTTFASSSNSLFYMSFNDTFNEFEDISILDGGSLIDRTYKNSRKFEYTLSGVTKQARSYGKIAIDKGVELDGTAKTTEGNVINYYASSSGLSATFNTGAVKPGRIIVPHDDKFDRFGKCDDWTISLWLRRESSEVGTGTILQKYSNRQQSYLDKRDYKRKIREIDFTPTSIVLDNKEKCPIYLGFDVADANTIRFRFQASDGAKACNIFTGNVSKNINEWAHLTVRNSASLCELFIDGTRAGLGADSSGSIPDGITANYANLQIGASGSNDSINGALAEIRMYDYAVSNTGINSLANNNYLSASLYQTNVVGNMFYKNAQAVVSSVLPKFHSGSGIFGNTWSARYRGTHTIYENEVLVRVPKDQFNISMNPTANYRPATKGEMCSPNHQNIPTGELRKPLFVSGTLHPYITSIGLYDDKAQMLATAKLAQPIQKNNDVDMNFIVRWDY
tara:strand:+ start:17021 stop:18850 length:1830 start_codon:yes stop_codon:yes gene_type:complete